MFHRPVKKMITEDRNSTFAKYLLNVTEHPTDFPKFIDSNGYVVLPRVAREFGLAVNNATHSIDINNERFYQGDFSNLTILDETSQLVCTFTGCTFESSQFQRSQFANVNMIRCIFIDVDFSNSNMRNANIDFLGFLGVVLDDADCSASVLTANLNNADTAIDSCSFQRTNLRNARMVTGDNKSLTHTMYGIYNSTFDGDVSNVTITGYDFSKNKWRNSQVSKFSLSNSKSALNPFGSYLFRNIFKNVTFQDSTLANAMFTENTFDGVAFDRVSLRETFWDLGEDGEENMDDDDSVDNVFRHTSMRDVDASNAMLIAGSVAAYHKPADLSAIDGIDYCTTDVIDYFKNNNVTISGNSIFSGRNNTFDCSLGIRIATIGVPLTIIAVIACAAFISRYLGKPCLDSNMIAMNMRLFKFRRDEEQSTPLLPLNARCQTPTVQH